MDGRICAETPTLSIHENDVILYVSALVLQLSGITFRKFWRILPWNETLVCRIILFYWQSHDGTGAEKSPPGPDKLKEAHESESVNSTSSRKLSTGFREHAQDIRTFLFTKKSADSLLISL